ncbi:MAG: hypothetical protein D6751_07130 [Deltaproteobacteria bacterium]|nr:MAG: hypothetical protein D6751_07130 [Deltaproteobacteria bacterium]
MADFNAILRQFGLGQVRATFVARADALEPGAAAFPAQEVEEGAALGGFAGRTSWLGTPVFSEVELDGFLLSTVVITVEQEKRIVTTAVNGRPGTIKEYFADGDYRVTLQGAIIAEGSKQYPAEQVRDLHDILRKAVALPAVSDFLRLFDIYKLVVQRYQFPQNEGFTNVQFYQIDCLSDTDESLVIDA